MFDRITIKYAGNYHEWGNPEHPLSELDISLNEDGSLSPAITDEEVKTAIMATLDVPNLQGYVVDPPQNERSTGQHAEKTVLNVRPTATYGRIP